MLIAQNSCFTEKQKMVDSLRNCEKDIVACLRRADVTSLAKDFLQRELLPPDFKSSHATQGPDQIRYLLSHVYKQLQALGRTARGSALYESCFQVLSKHGVSEEVMGKVRCSCNTAAAGTGLELEQSTACSSSSGASETLVADGSCKHEQEPSPKYFTQEHISDLTGILVEHSNIWYKLGVALKLPITLLQKIRREFSSSPELCMIEVLSEWVSWKPESVAKVPTLENLKEALSSNIVKLNHVAKHLEEILLESHVDLPLQATPLQATPINTTTEKTEPAILNVKGSQFSSGLVQEKHVSLLMDILAKYAHMWYEIGLALNLPRHVLKELQATLLGKSTKVFLDSVLYEWVSQKHPHAKPPRLEILKEVLAGDVVELGNVAGELEQRFSTAVRSESQQLSNTATLNPGQETIVSEKSKPSSQPVHSNLQASPSANKKHVRVMPTIPVHKDSVHATNLIDKYKKVLVDIYLAQDELPEDSWPPVSHGTFINLALIKQEDIKDSDEYARYTIQGDMDDVYKDKDLIKYESVFGDLSSGAHLLIEGRPGSGKTTLAHKVSRDWARGELDWKDVELLFLVQLRHFFSNPHITMYDIIERYCQHKSAVDQIIEYAESNSGKGFCFILDGLDEYTPKAEHDILLLTDNVIFKLIKRDIFPEAVVIVASRPAATAQFRKKATKRVETLGFFKDEIIQYIEKYNFSQDIKSKGLLTYLSLHPNVMHMCYLPIHTAMVCFLYDKMGNALPRTETEMYTKFTCHTLLRTLHREEVNVYLPSVEHLPCNKKQFFFQICKLAYEKTRASLQVIKGSEMHFTKNISTSKDSLGLLAMDHKASLNGKDTLYTFLHLTFQEYLAAYHIAHLPKEEQLQLIDESCKNENMQVVWKFLCGLVKHSPTIEHVMKSSSDDDLFRAHCAFESQQPDVCDIVIESGSPNQLAFQNRFLNPADFTAIGYVLKHATYSIIIELVLTGCKFGEEAINAFEAEVSLPLLRTVRYHGGNCSRDQVEILVSLLHRIPQLKILDLTDTTIGAAKTKFFSQVLSLPNLTVLQLSANQCNNKILKLLDTKNSKNSIKFIQTSLYRKGTNYHDKLATFEALQIPVLVYNRESLLGNFSNCTQLILPGCKFGDKEAKILGHALCNIPKLEILNLAFNCISDIGAQEVAAGISLFMIHFRVLNVSCNDIGDAGAQVMALATINPQGFKCFIWNRNISKKVAELLVSSTLVTKGLMITDAEITYFATYLSKCQTHFTELCSLQLSIAKVTSYLTSIKHCAQLETLSLEVYDLNGMDVDGAKALVEGIQCCLNLHTLIVSGNGIGSDGAIALAESLKNCNSLHTIQISKTGIDASGAITLYESLMNCSSLRTLRISETGIGLECSNSNGLQTLHLSGNGIGPISNAVALAKCLRNCNNLHTILMSETVIDASGAIALCESLRNCSSLRTLRISETGIGLECSNSNGLQTLHLSGNGIGPSNAVALAESLKNCSIMLISETGIDASGAITLMNL